MLFLVHFARSSTPVPAGEQAAIADRERDRAAELQREGVWRHLWRVTGRPENVGVFEVDSNDHLHEVLSSLPMFPYADITITPLSAHPAAVGTA